MDSRATGRWRGRRLGAPSGLDPHDPVPVLAALGVVLVALRAGLL